MELKTFFDNAKVILDILGNERSKTSELNIFTILNKETDEESTHCRFIYELLSPKGSHNQGDKFLKLFFEKVLGLTEYPYEYATVQREVWLTDKSRLDLMINTDDCCYLIEVKINAGEQPDQIKRYCEWAEKEGKKYKMYFLTLYGHNSNTAKEYTYSPISFKTHIIPWLEECKNATEIPSLKGAIEQYLQLLNKLTNEEKQNMEVLKSFIKNNIGIAQEINKILPLVKGEMVGNVLKDIETYISEKYNLISMPNVADYYKTKYHNYYTNHKDGKNPRISFMLSSDKNPEAVYFLSIVIEYSLFIGCDIMYKDTSNCYIPRAIKEGERKEKYYYNKGKTQSSLWLWWEYLKCKDSNINFYEENENFINLFNEDQYTDMLNEIKDHIDDIIEQLKKQGAFI
ncbi:MAG: PD-(D/E)XK nuclease family protein [Clostridia bacterium]|nr:PD-(D/E)XK nuclease family protein [Clostridia bacterium]